MTGRADEADRGVDRVVRAAGDRVATADNGRGGPKAVFGVRAKGASLVMAADRIDVVAQAESGIGAVAGPDHWIGSGASIVRRRRHCQK